MVPKVVLSNTLSWIGLSEFCGSFCIACLAPRVAPKTSYAAKVLIEGPVSMGWGDVKGNLHLFFNSMFKFLNWSSIHLTRCHHLEPKSWTFGIFNTSKACLQNFLIPSLQHLLSVFTTFAIWTAWSRNKDHWGFLRQPTLEQSSAPCLWNHACYMMYQSKLNKTYLQHLQHLPSLPKQNTNNMVHIAGLQKQVAERSCWNTFCAIWNFWNHGGILKHHRDCIHECSALQRRWCIFSKAILCDGHEEAAFHEALSHGDATVLPQVVGDCFSVFLEGSVMHQRLQQAEAPPSTWIWI